MSALDVFLLIVRWLHLVSAAAWIGGGLFYLVALRPALRRAPDASRAVNAAAAAEFRILVETCMFVLIATGVILTVNRLSPGVVGAPYVAALGAKIALSAWMFALAWSRRKRPRIDGEDAADNPSSGRLSAAIRAVSGYNAILILGLIVFLISDLLKTLYELALA